MFFYRSVCKLLCQLGSQEQGPGFLLCEHDWGKAISFHNGITGAGFSDNGYPGFIQGFHVPVDGTQADGKAISHFLSRHPFLTLEMGEYSMQSVNTIHGEIILAVSNE